MSPCCVGKLKFSMQGGTSFGAAQQQWRWQPRMAGSEEQVARAGEQLLAAAGAGSGAVDGVGCAAAVVAAAAAGAANTGPPLAPLRELRHPRSNAMLRILPDPERHYRLMAQVADTNFSLGEGAVDGQGGDGGLTGGMSHASALAVEAAAAFPSSIPEDSDQQEEEEAHLASTSIQALAYGDEKGSTDEAASRGSTVAAAAVGDDARRRAALCALAKLHVELDRSEAAREQGYAVGIFRMLHAGRMAKGDLLVGVPSECRSWVPVHGLLQQPDRMVRSDGIADRRVGSMLSMPGTVRVPFV